MFERDRWRLGRNGEFISILVKKMGFLTERRRTLRNVRGCLRLNSMAGGTSTLIKARARLYTSPPLSHQSNLQDQGLSVGETCLSWSTFSYPFCWLVGCHLLLNFLKSSSWNFCFYSLQLGAPQVLQRKRFYKILEKKDKLEWLEIGRSRCACLALWKDGKVRKKMRKRPLLPVEIIRKQKPIWGCIQRKRIMGKRPNSRRVLAHRFKMSKGAS